MKNKCFEAIVLEQHFKSSEYHREYSIGKRNQIAQSMSRILVDLIAYRVLEENQKFPILLNNFDGNNECTLYLLFDLCSKKPKVPEMKFLKKLFKENNIYPIFKKKSNKTFDIILHSKQTKYNIFSRIILLLKRRN